MSRGLGDVYKRQGQKNPTIDDLEEFAKGLKVPLEDLYESEYSRDKIKKLSQH